MNKFFLKPQWNVAVVGDGRLAQLIIQVIKLTCSNVTCFGKHENKLQSLVQSGIKIKLGIESTDEQLFDLVVEATGSNSGFTDTMKLFKTTWNCCFKIYNCIRENLDLTPTIINEITLIGSDVDCLNQQ
ncbi:MAG: hypothetical protein CM1200mP11_0210 [Nitrosopumilaceae archaeon]|nr:MAG: hypothetical protein CM1200mP11_0210 [Nitrosopumilaceae archaeon]